MTLGLSGDSIPISTLHRGVLFGDTRVILAFIAGKRRMARKGSGFLFSDVSYWWRDSYVSARGANYPRRAASPRKPGPELSRPMTHSRCHRPGQNGSSELCVKEEGGSLR